MSDKKTIVIRNILMVLVCAAAVALDQFTKHLAVLHLKGQADYPIIKGILELQYVENRGVAFGIMQNKQLPIIIITSIIMAGLIFLVEVTPRNKRMRPALICYMFIIAGAIGNLYDRIVNNYVVDFIYFKIINFPNFNVADICVTCGAIALIVLFMFYYKDSDKLTIFEKKKAEE